MHNSDHNRCGIPVVIMGETGCGKTKLIRYMCDLAKQNSGVKNMQILKVMVIRVQHQNHFHPLQIHGGITEREITLFINKAEEEARINRESNVDTVVFFDEANTTDAIDLIKEIMCDLRINGRPISKDIKFIAACNPYRK